MTALTRHEKDMIRYYEGDVSGDDPFWCDPRAYLTINSMFFDGVKHEIYRTEEEKKLNPYFFDDDERALDVCATLMRAGRKLISEHERKCWRVERYSDYLPMRRNGRTVSFTSTSSAGFLEYYTDRRGIALMEFTVMPGVPCIDMAQVLDEYAKAEEHEILLLPGTELRIVERPVEERYKSIKDMDGRPSIIQAKVKAVGNSFFDEDSESCGKDFDREALKRVYSALNSHRLPEEDDVSEYMKYKKWFRHALHEAIKGE